MFRRLHLHYILDLKSKIHANYANEANGRRNKKERNDRSLPGRQRKPKGVIFQVRRKEAALYRSVTENNEFFYT